MMRTAALVMTLVVGLASPGFGAEVIFLAYRPSVVELPGSGAVFTVNGGDPERPALCRVAGAPDRSWHSLFGAEFAMNRGERYDYIRGTRRYAVTVLRVDAAWCEFRIEWLDLPPGTPPARR